MRALPTLCFITEEQMASTPPALRNEFAVRCAMRGGVNIGKSTQFMIVSRWSVTALGPQPAAGSLSPTAPPARSADTRTCEASERRRP